MTSICNQLSNPNGKYFTAIMTNADTMAKVTDNCKPPDPPKKPEVKNSEMKSDVVIIKEVKADKSDAKINSQPASKISQLYPNLKSLVKAKKVTDIDDTATNTHPKTPSIIKKKTQNPVSSTSKTTQKENAEIQQSTACLQELQKQIKLLQQKKKKMEEECKMMSNEDEGNDDFNEPTDSDFYEESELTEDYDDYDQDVSTGKDTLIISNSRVINLNLLLYFMINLLFFKQMMLT